MRKVFTSARPAIGAVLIAIGLLLQAGGWIGSLLEILGNRLAEPDIMP